jgi:hypothetical protein
MSYNILHEGENIIAAGRSDFELGSGQGIITLDGEIPIGIRSDYKIVDKKLVKRAQALDEIDTIPSKADRREKIKEKLAELLIKRLVLVELGKDLTDINAKIDAFKARYNAL